MIPAVPVFSSTHDLLGFLFDVTESERSRLDFFRAVYPELGSAVPEYDAGIPVYGGSESRRYRFMWKPCSAGYRDEIYVCRVLIYDGFVESLCALPSFRLWPVALGQKVPRK